MNFVKIKYYRQVAHKLWEWIRMPCKKRITKAKKITPT